MSHHTHHDCKDYIGIHIAEQRCLACASIRKGEKTSLNITLLLYMQQAAHRISKPPQHLRFQLVLIRTDVASLSHQAANFYVNWVVRLGGRWWKTVK